VAEWQGFNVVDANRRVVHETDEPVSADRVISMAAGFDDAGQKLSSYTSFRCWRFRGDKPEAGQIVATVEAWGEDYGRARGEDLRLFGSAAFTITNVGPFNAIVDREGPQVDEINARVEENLEALTGLIM